MNGFFVITSSLFCLCIVRSIFFWLTIWQNNQYRPDRFFNHLSLRRHRSQLFFSAFIFFKWLLFLGFTLTVFYDSFLAPYQYLITFLYFFQFFLLIKELATNTFRKPVFNLRNQLIILLTLGASFLIFTLPLLDKFFWLLFIDLSIPFLT